MKSNLSRNLKLLKEEFFQLQQEKSNLEFKLLQVHAQLEIMMKQEADRVSTLKLEEEYTLAEMTHDKENLDNLMNYMKKNQEIIIPAYGDLNWESKILNWLKLFKTGLSKSDLRKLMNYAEGIERKTGKEKEDEVSVFVSKAIHRPLQKLIKSGMLNTIEGHFVMSRTENGDTEITQGITN